MDKPPNGWFTPRISTKRLRHHHKHGLSQLRRLGQTGKGSNTEQYAYSIKVLRADGRYRKTAAVNKVEGCVRDPADLINDYVFHTLEAVARGL